MRRLQLFGHLARRPSEEDHHRVLVATMSNPPTDREYQEVIHRISG